MAPHDILLLMPDAGVAQLEAERAFSALLTVLTPILPATADVSHVGATSIPGCVTKGDLDVVIRVQAADFAAAEAALARRFRRNSGSIRTGDFTAFEAPDRVPQLGIQLTTIGGTFDIFHLFAEALRTDPDRLHRYNDLKRAFQGRPMDSYRSAKAAFIDETLRALSDDRSGRTPR